VEKKTSPKGEKTWGRGGRGLEIYGKEMGKRSLGKKPIQREGKEGKGSHRKKTGVRREKIEEKLLVIQLLGEGPRLAKKKNVGRKSDRGERKGNSYWYAKVKAGSSTKKG